MRLHQRLGRSLAVLVGALTLLTTAPASADHGITTPHWSNGKWGVGTETTWNYRWFYLLDRSGNATVRQATQQVIADFKYDLDARGWWGHVPAPVYVDDSGSAGQCGFFTEYTKMSFITMCMTGGTGGVAYSGGTHSAEPYHPHMYIGSGIGTYAGIYNVIYHELIHALGVVIGECTLNQQGQVVNMGPAGADHSCQTTSLMYPVVPINALKRPSGHDYEALSFYRPPSQGGHPTFG